MPAPCLSALFFFFTSYIFCIHASAGRHSSTSKHTMPAMMAKGTNVSSTPRRPAKRPQKSTHTHSDSMPQCDQPLYPAFGGGHAHGGQISPQLRSISGSRISSA